MAGWRLLEKVFFMSVCIPSTTNGKHSVCLKMNIRTQKIPPPPPPPQFNYYKLFFFFSQKTPPPPPGELIATIKFVSVHLKKSKTSVSVLLFDRLIIRVN